MTLVLAAGALGAVSCAAPQPVQPFTGEGRGWPSSPEPARIQFVTEFSGPADLGIRPTLLSRLAGFAAGPGGEAMERPMAVAATPDGRVIFVADPDAGCVHRFDLERGRYERLDTGSDGALASPVGLAIDATGRIFVADSALDAVLVAAPGSDMLEPLALYPPPKQPTGLALGPFGDLFVASTGSHSVRRYDAAGRLVREYGGRGDGPGEMNFPTYLWLSPPTELLVSDTMNFRIQRIDAQNGVLGVFGKVGNGAGNLARPKGIAMDRHGHIYVVDGVHHAMQIFDRDGRLLLAVGEQGSSIGQFWLPSGVFATANDLIFVADAYNRRVQVFRYVEVDP
jgi:sugar lactone lactonase YvrE